MTITLEYDGRNKVVKELIAQLLKSGAKRMPTEMEEAMDDVKCGRVNTYKSVNDMFRRLGL